MSTYASILAGSECDSHTFRLCVSFDLGWVSWNSIYMGFVFLSIKLPYVFWLQHLSHLIKLTIAR